MDLRWLDKLDSQERRLARLMSRKRKSAVKEERYGVRYGMDLR